MLKSKAVIKDVARVLGIDHREAESIIKLFPQKVLNFSLNEAWTGKTKKDAPVAPDYDNAPLQALVNSRESYRELWDIALKLEDLPRQTGVHACGVVITPSPIYELAPLYRAAPTDTPVVMYDKHYAEDIGLLKMDFLGLINLSIILDTVNMVQKIRHLEVDMDKIPTDDKETFELLSKGMTTAVFQFESPGMQKYLRELKPSRISDLIAMNALYRPGPIDQIPHFIARKLGKESIDCYHKDLEPVLAETYGVIVYQEQVMQLAQILGGYTLGGADNIRRIMAKKMPDKMAKLEPEFKSRCVKSLGCCSSFLRICVQQESRSGVCLCRLPNGLSENAFWPGIYGGFDDIQNGQNGRYRDDCAGVQTDGNRSASARYQYVARRFFCK